MDDRETCPQCAQRFDAADNRCYYTPFRRITMFVPTIPKDTPGSVLFGLMCPYCGYKFQSRTLRYFGWISYPVFFGLLVGLLVLLLAIAPLLMSLR